jgi:superfamily II DNA or RNA helicase
MPKRTSPVTGSELFIVDNSDQDWKVRRYLHDWCQLSDRIDVATGYFEIGALLSLGDEWQKVDEIRILMGDEVSLRTKKAFADGLAQSLQRLDASLEAEKLPNAFLHGVPAIVDAIRSGKIKCRVYRKEKFHAKAYITHGRQEVIGSFGLIGSSNFTYPGLNENIELNVQITGGPVTVLQEWFDEHWQNAEDVTAEVLKVIERHIREYSPFDVYAKALQEYFRGHELTATEWDEGRSQMFPKLDRYQKEAYWALLKIARQNGGAFLCDGVGLGKTFVGLMLIERLILHEDKKVVLFAPKAAKEGVWEPHLREWLPHVGGTGGSADFSSLAVFAHTDLGRKGDFPGRFKRMTELADVVIVDEAHHFRNPGRAGTIEGKEPSRYHQLFSLLDAEVRPKSLYMLTATPINNSLSDFRHMVELFSRRDETYFARTLGVNSLRSHFTKMEKSLYKKVGGDDVSDVAVVGEAQEILASDSLFQHLVVQRSRAYAKESQLRETGKAAVFPDRKPPQVAEYSIHKTYGRLLTAFEKAFQKTEPLFTLPMYYPLAWARNAGEPLDADDARERNRQKQVVGLIRTTFLKRFESSVAAFESSCTRLLNRLMAFVEVHCDSIEKIRFRSWQDLHADVLGYAHKHQLSFWSEDVDEELGEDSDDTDPIPLDLLEAAEAKRLPEDEFNVPLMVAKTMDDLDQIVLFLKELRKFKANQDDKIQKLIKLLKSKELAGQKVLIFTEFADTARYLRAQLKAAGIDGIGQVDSGTKANRAEVIRRFAPYYNGTSSGELANRGETETRVLVSTDVLSEGLNLQDASRMVNYDIHWNPVRLMQRIGRVDRRMNPEIEMRLVADHPEVRASRGTASFWNFLPPDELNALLTLYSRVTQKTLLISKTFGIEGGKLLTPEDDFEALREFNHAYEGTRTAVEDMHLEYQALVEANPELADRLSGLPGSTFSGRERVSKCIRGVFFCYALPALDKETGEFSEAAGTTRWYLFDLDAEKILEDPGEIVACIRSTPETPRRCATEQKTLVEIRDTILKHIKNSYLRRVDAPVGVRPSLKCWMELNEG